MTAPRTELERLRALEWTGSRAAYADTEWPTCPVCEYTCPDERASEWLYDRVCDRPYPGPDYDARLRALVDAAAKNPEERPSGPRHALDCWLAARIEELEGRRGLASARTPG